VHANISVRWRFLVSRKARTPTATGGCVALIASVPATFRFFIAFRYVPLRLATALFFNNASAKPSVPFCSVLMLHSVMAFCFTFK